MNELHRDLTDHERANQAHWDETSDWYQEHHGVPITNAPEAWGMFRVPETEVKAVAEVDGRDVLELGCGGGQWAIALARRGARVVGLDISERQLAYAASAAASAGVMVSWVHASAEDVPLGASTFDLVLSDHGGISWADPYRAIPEVARLLLPRGRFVFCATSPIATIAYDDKSGAGSRALVKDYFGLHRSEEEGGAVTFQMTHGDRLRLLRESGFEILDLVELRPSPGAVSTFWPDDPDWPLHWPADEVWVAERR